MSHMSCFASADLNSLRLFTGEREDASWTASSPLPTEPEDGPKAARSRSTEASAFLASKPGARRRLQLLCFDTEEAMCAWVRTPSAEPTVIAAALRSAGQEWGERFSPGVLQALTDPNPPASAEEEPKGSKPPSAFAALTRPLGRSASEMAPLRGPVFAAPLSLARLWLDALDARGIRPDHVVSLWHAMAAAWTSEARADNPDQRVAVILADQPTRAVWCWARQGLLECGGQVALPRMSPPTSDDASPTDSGTPESRRLSGAAFTAEAPTGADASPHDPRTSVGTRLALDWLAWATQLGGLPRHVVVVGAEAQTVARSLAERWPDLALRAVEMADPIGPTLSRAATALGAVSSTQPDPRRTLVALEARPTRATRQQYRWTAAALVCVAFGLAGLGWRMSRQSVALRDAANEIDSRASAFVQSLNDPTLAQSRSLVRALESQLVELQKREPPKLPPAPRPIRDELLRMLDVLAKHEGIKLITLTIDSRGSCAVHLTIPDIRTGEEIKLALQRSGSEINWTEAPGAGADRTLRLNGTWATLQ